jgi:hypothetical protein
LICTVQFILHIELLQKIKFYIFFNFFAFFFAERVSWFEDFGSFNSEDFHPTQKNSKKIWNLIFYKSLIWKINWTVWIGHFNVVDGRIHAMRCILDFFYISLLLIKHVCVLILQWFRFFIEFLKLISLIKLSHSLNNVTISITICVEVRIFSQFCLLHEMLHNLKIQLFYFVFFFS